MQSTPDCAGRFHLQFTSAGRPIQHGWWNSEAVARTKLARWVGEYGTLPEGRLTLTDETTGTLMQTWPDEA